jgi:ketosteroid isomerase-like protein
MSLRGGNDITRGVRLFRNHAVVVDRGRATDLASCPKQTGPTENERQNMAEESLDDFLGRYHEALGEFMRGNHEPARDMWSGREDITLGNPFGPFARGITEVEDAMKRAASNYRDGQAIGFDAIARYVEGGLAVIAEVERLESKVGGEDHISHFNLRVTSVLCREDGRWRLLHRHADAITTPQGAESILAQT